MSVISILKPVADSILSVVDALEFGDFKQADYVAGRMEQLSKMPAVTIEGIELKLKVLLTTGFHGHDKELVAYMNAWRDQDLAYVKKERVKLFSLLRAEVDGFNEWGLLLNSIEQDIVKFSCMEVSA